MSVHSRVGNISTLDLSDVSREGGAAVTEWGLPTGGSPLQQRLAAAAVELFYRQGALATSVRQITEACGLTPGALYNHFESKDQLLYVVVRDIHLRLETV